MRELLDDFSRGGLWAGLAGKPEVEITLRQTIGSAYDITERVSAENELERTRSLLRAAAEQSAAGE